MAVTLITFSYCTFLKCAVIMSSINNTIDHFVIDITYDRLFFTDDLTQNKACNKIVIKLIIYLRILYSCVY